MFRAITSDSGANRVRMSSMVNEIPAVEATSADHRRPRGVVYTRGSRMSMSTCSVATTHRRRWGDDRSALPTARRPVDIRRTTPGGGHIPPCRRQRSGHRRARTGAGGAMPRPVSPHDGGRRGNQRSSGPLGPATGTRNRRLATARHFPHPRRRNGAAGVRASHESRFPDGMRCVEQMLHAGVIAYAGSTTTSPLYVPIPSMAAHIASLLSAEQRTDVLRSLGLPAGH